jgi:hypothetical protein
MKCVIRFCLGLADRSVAWPGRRRGDAEDLVADCRKDVGEAASLPLLQQHLSLPSEGRAGD